MDDLRKDRLALVSGTVVVWGVVLVQLWSAAAHFQTGGNYHAWTMNTPGQGVLTALWIFWFITALMTFGGLAVLLSVVHVLCYGLSLVDEPDEAAGQAASSSNTLTRFAYLTFAAVFYQWFVVVFMLALVPLVLFSGVIEQLMAHFLSARAAGWIARMMVTIFLMMVFMIKVFPRFVRFVRTTEVRKAAFRIRFFSAVCFVFAVLWGVVVEACYTVSLSVDSKILRHDQGATVTVALGGSTSDLRQARLQLNNEQGAVLQTLVLHEAAGPGDYFCYIPVAGLAPGSYRVTLQYPHTSLSSSFPYIRGSTVRSQTFLVLP